MPPATSPPLPAPAPLLRREQLARSVVVLLLALSLGGLFGALVGRPALGLLTAASASLLLLAPLLSRWTLARLVPRALAPCPLHPSLGGTQLLTRGARGWVDLELALRPGGLRPRDVQVRLEGQGRLQGEGTFDAQEDADGVVRLRVPARAVLRGPVTGLRVHLASAWPLGVFTERRAHALPADLLVLPRARTQEARRLLARHDDPNSRAARAAAEGEVLELRGWRPGESLRRVHWKVSARRARRVVRVLAEGPRRELRVHLHRGASPGRLVAFEHAVELCAGLLEAGLAAGHRVHLDLDGAHDVGRATRREELLPLRVELARVAPVGAGRDGARGQVPGAGARLDGARRSAGAPRTADTLSVHVHVLDELVPVPEGQGLFLAVDPEGRFTESWRAADAPRAAEALP